MQMTAHAPQKLLAALEQTELRRGEEAGGDEFLRLTHAIDIFGDPEQRVEIAQAALAFLHIRLDEIARGAGAHHARVAFGELGGDEFARIRTGDLAIEALAELAEQLGVAENEARFEKRRSNGHVGAGLTHALGDGARRMADLLTQIPKNIKDRLDDAFAPRGLFVRDEKQKIDVGARRERPASIAANRDNGETLSKRRIVDDVNVAHDIVVDGADQLVFEP